MRSATIVVGGIILTDAVLALNVYFAVSEGLPISWAASVFIAVLIAVQLVMLAGMRS